MVNTSGADINTQSNNGMTAKELMNVLKRRIEQEQ